MSSVLIAGSNGLVGRAILRKAPPRTDVWTPSRREVDFKDYEATKKYLKEIRPSVVFVAAAKVGGIGANSRFQKEFLSENLMIQNSILLAAADQHISTLVFLGSSCIYPKLAPQPISEESLLTGALEPTNEGYAIAKIAGIRLAKAIFEQDGLKFFSLMPTNLYGPNDNFDKYSSHVPAALMRRFHEAKINGDPEVIVWGTGTPRREFMHVDDMASACWHMVDQQVGGELINIGTGVDISILEFAMLMAKVVGFKGEVVFDGSKPDGTPRKLLDVSKAHSLGWRHRINLEEGLSQTYAWFVDALTKGEVRGY